jgi:Bacterial Ig domain
MVAALAGTSLAGPDNVLLIADPGSADSLHIANYYINARGLSDANVLFMDPTAPDHAALVATRLPSLFGTLANRSIEDHIDYILLSPPKTTRMRASSTIRDNCFPVTHFSLGSTYTMAFVADEVLAGMASTTTQRYYSSSPDIFTFDSSTGWSGGHPSSTVFARRYFIGGVLAFTGSSFGNTIQEVKDMIDRSVQADGSRPAGTFYLMDNTADPSRNVRTVQYPGPAGAVARLASVGQTASVVPGALPIGQHDALGVMTGFAGTNITNADFTLVPGAFADHLTSHAATFSPGQTQMSEWITKGASGTVGAVQEPCNYQGKFPRAHMHYYYAQGATLGEAYFRSAQYIPFQALLYGDPVTRPFAHIPQVSVPNAPTQPVSGTITLSPQASTTHPTATIASFDLLIDGTLYTTISPAASFSLDTTKLSDGLHDVRVIGYDNTNLKTRGRWIGTIEVNNLGRTAAMGVVANSGDLGTAFTFDLVNPSGGAAEVRLTHAGRIVAANPAGGPVTVYGRTLGAGPARLTPEALYPDGSIVKGPAVTINITPTGATTGATPIAYSSTVHVLDNQPFVIQLPATFDDDFPAATFTLATQPTKSTLVMHAGASHATFEPGPNAVGSDQLTYSVTTSGGTSTTETVTIIYTSGCFADCDKSTGVGTLDIFDFLCFQNQFVAANPNACDCDTSTGPATCDIFDFLCFQNSFVAGCP